MDSTNYNVLQFVSVAAQILERQGGSSELLDSLDADQQDDQQVNGSKQLRELLAEAADATYEEANEILSPTDIVPSSIEERLKTVFNLLSSEPLRGEWPCYIVQSAIVSGNMYLTDNFICFFASLPKGQFKFHKSGYLSIKKSNKSTVRFEKYYFVINQDVLAWYKSPTDNYSPLGKIDLKSILKIRQSTKKEYSFKIKTTTKTWYFKTESKAGIIEWTHALQIAIFKANNNGPNLKITLPFQTIHDIEQTEAFEFQKILKIETNENMVVNEYYFYFGDIQSVFQKLQSTWEKHPSFKHISSSFDESFQSSSSSPMLDHMSSIRDSVSIPGTISDVSCSYKKPSDCDQNDPQEVSSSDDEDYQEQSWLHGKRQSGMQLIYGLLGGTVGSPSTALEEDEEDEEESNKRIGAEVLDNRNQSNFRKYFVLPDSDKLLEVYKCSYVKRISYYGKLYISKNHVSFNSKGFVSRAQIIIPFTDIVRIQKLGTQDYISHYLSIHTHKKLEFSFGFSSKSKCNSCFAALYLQHKTALMSEQGKTEEDWEEKIMEEGKENMDHIVPHNVTLPILSQNMPSEIIIYKKPEKELHFTCITIGTRGDVQPYIALCKGLMKDGHRCRIATHDEFKDWIEEHDIEFESIGGDPGELMRICVENNFFSVNFVKEGLRLFKDWIDELLDKTWKAVQGTDVIIESPSAMIGVHMAEALCVPYFRAFPMPMTRTPSFPHPFATPNHPKGSLYNNMTYILFEYAIWRAISARTNAFRKNELKIPHTTYEKLEIEKIPYLYSFSPSIVPSPRDWSEFIHRTGYWFLDNPQTGWMPDQKLKAFVESKDLRPLVYIGFGSIIVPDPKEITRIIIEAVLLSNVRAIVSKGWLSRLQQDGNAEQDALAKHPDTIFSIHSVPHDWLFPKVRAVFHHGGAGTTAAGLRAGRPTIIKPFFADQFFWGERIEEMGLGQCIKQLTVHSLSAALLVVSTDEHMLKLAKKAGEKIRSESGVETAIQCIYRDMEHAKERTLSSSQKSNQSTEEYAEEGWTLIENSISESMLHEA